MSVVSWVFYDFLRWEKENVSMFTIHCDISHLLRPKCECAFMCESVRILFLSSSVVVSSLSYKFCANVCVTWALAHAEKLPRTIHTVVVVVTLCTNNLAVVCVCVRVCDWLPEHLDPWWYKPYKSEPQWSQNVGLEYEYSLNSCLVRVSWW